MTYWNRLEPNSADADLEESVEARIADPLWMMARQWQLGEFKGEDAASPIHARVVVSSYAIDTFRNEAAPGSTVEPFRSARPLECRVEAEVVLDGPSAVGLAAEAGAQFLRRLELAGLGDARRSVDWSSELGFDLTADGIDTTLLPERVRLRLDLLTRRGLDGRRLHALSEVAFTELLGDAADDALPVFRAWRAEYADRFDEPGKSGDCWVDERLEYGFSLGVATREGEVVLEADEYPGGRLDWYSFRVSADKTHGLGRGAAKTQQVELLPQPAMFRGQGAPRWWEFEDRRVYFGNLSAGPADVARLVVAAYGTVFSDDWFVIPVGIDVGTLSQVRRLDVIDVFGGVTEVKSAAANDDDVRGDARPFRFFELQGDDSPKKGLAPWLLVPPALADSQHGKPVEHVTLVRDEQANLGWAIEHAIELPTGGALKRRLQGTGRTDGAEAPGEGRFTGEGEPPWRYRLQTPVPPWWIPLVPERTGKGADTRLRRARMGSWDELDPAVVGAKGRLIGMDRALRLYEEEVPRGGVSVTRRWERARGSDGRVHLWMARRKRPGRGDRASGLKFDVIQRHRPPGSEAAAAAVI
jgi:hypothetical protein